MLWLQVKKQHSLRSPIGPAHPLLLFSHAISLCVGTEPGKIKNRTPFSYPAEIEREKSFNDKNSLKHLCKNRNLLV